MIISVYFRKSRVFTILNIKKLRLQEHLKNLQQLLSNILTAQYCFLTCVHMHYSELFAIFSVWSLFWNFGQIFTLQISCVNRLFGWDWYRLMIILNYSKTRWCQQVASQKIELWIVLLIIILKLVHLCKMVVWLTITIIITLKVVNYAKSLFGSTLFVNNIFLNDKTKWSV
jgi:hypothetical protein